MAGRLVALAVFSICVLPYVLLYILWPTSHLWLPDDAFYYFEIARNIGAGHGSTFDGINPTNGYHPLWQLILGALAVLVQSHSVFVTVVIVIQCVLLCFAWTIAYWLLFPQFTWKTLAATCLVGIGVTWNYYLAKSVLNGLESALYLAVSMLLLWMFSRTVSGLRAATIGRAAMMGVVAALVIFSRLDSIFYLAGVFVTWCLFRPRTLSQQWKAVVIFCAVLAVALLAYMYVNKQIFGICMPVSGYVKRIVAETGATPGSITMLLFFVGSILLGVRLALGHWPGKLRDARIAALVTLSIVLIIYEADALLVRGRLFREVWYLSQHLLWGLMVTALLVNRLLNNRMRLFRYLGIGAIGLVAVTGIALTWRVRLQRVSYDHALALMEASEWINANLPEDTTLGGWDCGRLGFYINPPLVNLDGLVNSYEYVQYLRENRSLDFMDNSGIQYIVQYYRPDFETYHRRGLDLVAFRRRAQEVIWSRQINFAPMSTFMRTGRRTVESYQLDVRAYQPPS